MVLYIMQARNVGFLGHFDSYHDAIAASDDLNAPAGAEIVATPPRDRANARWELGHDGRWRTTHVWRRDRIDRSRFVMVPGQKKR